MKSGILIVFLIVCSALVTACSGQTKTIEQSKTANPDLVKNRSLWEGRKTANYDFVSTKLQGGVYGWVPVLIKVRNGKVVSMEPVRKAGELERTDGYEDFDTVEKMFDKIRESYDKRYPVVVTYNKEFGYPENIRIEPGNGAPDTGFSIVISKFEIAETN